VLVDGITNRLNVLVVNNTPLLEQDIILKYLFRFNEAVNLLFQLLIVIELIGFLEFIISNSLHFLSCHYAAPIYSSDRSPFL
jgi:hypothetical protein